MIFQRFLTVIILFFAGAFIVPATCFAQTSDSIDRLFTIKAVKVDVVSRRASEARRIALANAEQQAYAKLLRKITQPSGRDRLPELNSEQIQNMISGIQVVEEQSSSRRYVAALDVRFEPSIMSRFLAQYNVPHVLGTGQGLIVLHAHSDGLTNYLWQPKESTVKARSYVDWLNRIRTYVFPQGALWERAAISFREVAEFKTGIVAEIAKKYDVQSAILIYSQWKELSHEAGSLTYRFYSTDGDWQKKGIITIESSDAAEEEAQRRMFESILEDIDTAWRDQLLVDTGVQGELTALIPSTGLDVLSSVEAKLGDVSLVRSFELTSIGIPFSRIQFHYTGRKEQLVMALRYAGLDLNAYGDDHILKLHSNNE